MLEKPSWLPRKQNLTDFPSSSHVTGGGKRERMTKISEAERVREAERHRGRDGEAERESGRQRDTERDRDRERELSPCTRLVC